MQDLLFSTETEQDRLALDALKRRAHHRAVTRPPGRFRMRADMLLRIPGFAAQFTQHVPPDHVDRDGSRVRCICGRHYELAVGELEECAGSNHDDGLMRAFLRVETSVRVARWETGA